MPLGTLDLLHVYVKPWSDHVQQNWFRTITDLYTSRNRLLSRLQQFAHALDTSSDENWLADSPRYQPTGGETLYAALRFSIRGGL